MLHINDFILQAQQKGASDLHIVCGLPIKCRLDGKMQTLSDTVPTPQDCEVLAQELAGAQFETIRESGELDLAASESEPIFFMQGVRSPLRSDCSMM